MHLLFKSRTRGTYVVCTRDRLTGFVFDGAKGCYARARTSAQILWEYLYMKNSDFLRGVHKMAEVLSP